jgi:hypothetical protein
MADETTGISEINERAPVVGRAEIEIAATPQVAWDVLTQIDRWPSWNADVKSARLLRTRLQKTLDTALHSGLEHLKAEAERRERRE